MEKLDYRELIDPLCIPVIKILREDLGVETMFCCQGKSKKDLDHHSISGYIACKITQRNKEILLELADLLSQRTDLEPSICSLQIRYNSKRATYKGNDAVILRLRPLEDVEVVWKVMEEILKTRF